MGSRVLRIPLHHIEQDGVVSSNNYVEQGNLFTNDFNNVISGNHSYKLFFKIPDDIYKYDLGFVNSMYPNSRYFAFVVDTSSLVKNLFNRYFKWTYEDGRISYQADSTETTQYDGSSYMFITPASIIEPDEITGFDNKSIYYASNTPVTVENNEIFDCWQVTKAATEQFQNTSEEYFVVYLTPGIESFSHEYESGYIRKSEQINTFYNKWLTDSFEIAVEARDIDIYAYPVYPVNVYARNDRSLTVAWNFSNSADRDISLLYPTESTVVITDKNGDIISKTISGDGTSLTFSTSDLEGLAVGDCTVEVTVTTNYDTEGVNTWTFTLVGEGDAPEITSITQNSYPTITWESDDQISWELQISNANGIVYKTGMIPGDDSSYTVPKLLEDGEYSVEMRYVNIYGIVSGWGSYYLDLNPTKPDAPENIVVSARADFGISISCDEIETTGKLLAVRRKDSESESEVLGEYNGSFVDYLVGLNDPHEYTIRNYVEGYADGDWIDGVLLYSGIVVRDAEDYSRYVHIWMSEDQTINLVYSEQRSDVLSQCVGRKYPVAEQGEWITSMRSFTGYVSNEGFNNLLKMKSDSSHVLLQNQNEFFPCYMEISDRGEYINKGRIVDFKLTRIDGDK